jgi:predicted ester cyclase
MCMGCIAPARERRVGKEGEEEAPVSDEEENNKALVRRYFAEAWSKGNVAAVDEFMAPNYVEYPTTSGVLPPGPEGLKEAITTYHMAFPDLEATLDDIFAEGEMVAYRWILRGTHLGEWLGIPPPVTTLRRAGSVSTGSLRGRWWKDGSVSSR